MPQLFVDDWVLVSLKVMVTLLSQASEAVGLAGLGTLSHSTVTFPGTPLSVGFSSSTI